MQSVRATTLIPRGFLADDTVDVCDGTLIAIRPKSLASPCPACGGLSVLVHSRYTRRLSDLPMAGRRVQLVLRARRFHCDAVLCGRRIFTERFDKDVLAPWARRTARLDHIVHHLALALGGRPAESFSHRLMMPERSGNDTALASAERIEIKPRRTAPGSPRPELACRWIAGPENAGAPACWSASAR